jgi:2-oxoisovalerate dehydrogenase E1 component
MRGANPTIFFEHRSLLMTSDGSARYPGDDYLVPFGRATVLREGSELTVVSWGALVHRCAEAIERIDGASSGGRRVELIDLRTIAPWDRECVLASVRKTGRCLIAHEDNITAGFGAEIAATLAKEAFWHLDAPVDRIAVEDVPMPYHPVLLDAVLPTVERIAARIEELLSV